jgi:hypothetical protein
MFAALTCAAAFAIPVAGASAGSENSNAAIAKQCAAEKKADKAAFKATYGDHAMRSCIKNDVAATVADFVNAAETCRDQRNADEAGFMAQWGTNDPRGEELTNGEKKNAFGKCVSATAKTLHEEPTA